MKCANVVKIIVMLLIALIILPGTISKAETSGKWVLVDVIDDENITSWNTANDSTDSYEFDHTYSRGNYSILTTYIGDTDTYYNPPKLNGEAFEYTVKWSLPPTTFKADDPVSLNVSVSVTKDTQSFFSGNGNTRAYWGNSNISNANSKYFYEVFGSTDSKKRPQSVSDTVSFTPGAGSEGSQRKISFEVDRMHTEFVYEWSSTKQPINPLTHNLVVEPKPEIKPSKQEIFDKNPIDSGVRFSDLFGEVSIKRSGEDDDSYEFAELDMVIYEGDVIRVKDESGVVFSMPSMDTVLCGQGIIIMNTQSEKESKIKLLAGNIYTNVKSMIINGTMEVEMGQAVAGIKGTTFILEETGTSSSVKVLEGVVEFTSIKTGKSVMVKAGNSAKVTNGGDPIVGKISIADEAKGFNKTIIELQLDNKYMKVNGIEAEIDPGRGTVPMIIADRTMIPIRSVIESLGGTVGYEAKEKKITLKLAGKTLEMWVDNKTIKIDGKTVVMDVAPVVINDRTMVPVRFAAENLGYDVDWHQKDKKAIIQ